MSVALVVPASLPSEHHVQRWAGEPVKALLLPTSVFVTNRRGYPALSKAHQALLLQCFNFGVQVCPCLAACLWSESVLQAFRLEPVTTRALSC